MGCVNQYTDAFIYASGGVEGRALLLRFAMNEKEKRDIGMSLSADSKREWLEYCRKLAVYLCSKNGTVTADDVRCYMEKNKINVEPGNWMGSIFKCSDFETTGDWAQSKHKNSHARAVRVWKLTSRAENIYKL